MYLLVNYVATTGIPTISTSLPSTVDKLSSLAAMDKPAPIIDVQVGIGGTAKLPCKIINPQGKLLIYKKCHFLCMYVFTQSDGR